MGTTYPEESVARIGEAARRPLQFRFCLSLYASVVQYYLSAPRVIWTQIEWKFLGMKKKKTKKGFTPSSRAFNSRDGKFTVLCAKSRHQRHLRRSNLDLQDAADAEDTTQTYSAENEPPGENQGPKTRLFH